MKGDVEMKTIDSAQVIDESNHNILHLSVVGFCLMLSLCDGYDFVVYGTVVPAIMITGSLVFEALGDKLRRKTAILIAIASLGKWVVDPPVDCFRGN